MRYTEKAIAHFFTPEELMTGVRWMYTQLGYYPDDFAPSEPIPEVSGFFDERDDRFTDKELSQCNIFEFISIETS